MSGMRGVAVRRGRVPDQSFEAKLSARGQVVIPQPLREWAKLHGGTMLTFTPQPDGSILIRRSTPENGRFSKLRGAGGTTLPLFGSGSRKYVIHP